MRSLQSTQIDGLKTVFGGELLAPDAEGYDAARRVWNAMVDRRPALIARCASVSDVVHAVSFAREHALPLAVRGGGHHIAGHATCDGGLVIDLSRMNEVSVDAAARRAYVGGGATLADVDDATTVHGLATPLGINSTTGVAGLALGGGFGWLSRPFGLTADQLEAATVVTASGRVLRASADQHADLFWALRGGSGNFGVVTRFELRLHAVGPDLLSGLIVYPLEAGRTVLRRYRDLVAAAPDELTVWAILRSAPPLPFLPAEVHGRPIVALALLYAGDPAEGAEWIEPLRALGMRLGEHVGVQPYSAWQRAFDPLLAAGARNYWKSHNLSALEDGLIEAAMRGLEQLPSPQCEIFLAALGGAASRPTADSTAYPHRDTRFVMNLHGRWEDPANDASGLRWVRDLHADTARFAGPGVYVNFLGGDEPERVRSAYGANYARLARVKRTWDPENLFRLNQNVLPEVAGRR